MKRAILLITIAVLLFFCTAIFVRVVSGSHGSEYAVESGTISGGSYSLTSHALRDVKSQKWQVSGVASSSGFRLQALNTPAFPHGGCCCVYLPCTLSEFP
jgi:hypothetical protein